MYPALDVYSSLYWLLGRPDRRILVVEDDPAMREILPALLRAAVPNTKVQWSESAEEAIHLLSRSFPDLVISDCILGPGETGFDVWRHCRKTCPQVPFLMITGKEPRSLLPMLAELGGHWPQVMHKPLHPSELKLAVIQQLGSRWSGT